MLWCVVEDVVVWAEWKIVQIDLDCIVLPFLVTRVMIGKSCHTKGMFQRSYDIEHCCCYWVYSIHGFFLCMQILMSVLKTYMYVRITPLALTPLEAICACQMVYHTHTRIRAHTHTHTHACTHARTHTHTTYVMPLLQMIIT